LQYLLYPLPILPKYATVNKQEDEYI